MVGCLWQTRLFGTCCHAVIGCGWRASSFVEVFKVNRWWVLLAMSRSWQIPAVFPHLWQRHKKRLRANFVQFFFWNSIWLKVTSVTALCQIPVVFAGTSDRHAEVPPVVSRAQLVGGVWRSWWPAELAGLEATETGIWRNLQNAPTWMQFYTTSRPWPCKPCKPCKP